ncbi:hypothetical protein PUN28_006119 [Cardiocondyla obscurior]|uniref:Secreted protein n=1 Tax=Cardiocondyla obscurior TaxID=286306 RepID=A0AAW2G912_9HYME
MLCCQVSKIFFIVFCHISVTGKSRKLKTGPYAFASIPHNAAMPDLKNIFYRFLAISQLPMKVEIPHNKTLPDSKNIFFFFLDIFRLLVKVESST